MPQREIFVRPDVAFAAALVDSHPGLWNLTNAAFVEASTSDPGTVDVRVGRAKNAAVTLGTETTATGAGHQATVAAGAGVGSGNAGGDVVLEPGASGGGAAADGVARVTRGGLHAVGGGAVAGPVHLFTVSNLNSGGIGFRVAGPTISGNYNLLHALGSTTGSLNYQLENTENATAGSHASLTLRSGGSSGGDPYLYFSVATIGAADWSIGVDNSDSDALLICNANALGTSVALRINSSERVTIPTGLRVGFTGDPTGDDLVEVGDATFALVHGTSPELRFDTNDALRYVRASDLYEFRIGAAVVADLNATRLNVVGRLQSDNVDAAGTGTDVNFTGTETVMATTASVSFSGNNKVLLIATWGVNNASGANRNVSARLRDGTTIAGTLLRTNRGGHVSGMQTFGSIHYVYLPSGGSHQFSLTLQNNSDGSTLTARDPRIDVIELVND